MCALDSKSPVSQRNAQPVAHKLSKIYPIPISKAWVCFFASFARFCWSNLIVYSLWMRDSVKQRTLYKWCPRCFALPVRLSNCLHHPSFLFLLLFPFPYIEEGSNVEVRQTWIQIQSILFNWGFSLGNLSPNLSKPLPVSHLSTIQWV